MYQTMYRYNNLHYEDAYLAASFRVCGEIWTIMGLDLFLFENLNGLLKKFVHGTRFVSNQVRIIGI